MLIGVTGSISSGKSEVVRFLVNQRGFSQLYLSKDPELKESSFLDVVSNNFISLEGLLKYITANWNKNFVIDNIADVLIIEALRKRPFFLLVAVNSSLSKRFFRWCLNNSEIVDEFILFKRYIEEEDKAFSIEKTSELTNSDILSLVDLTIQNEFSTLQELHQYLEKVDLTDPERLRPSWDSYFILLTELACLRSNCMKRRVGCIVVKDNRVLATGYNGTPRNVPNCNAGGCPRCNSNSSKGQNLDICLCIHAEENALLEAGRERISGGHSILYCNTCPCIGCAKKIVQVGIKEVVYSKEYYMDNQTIELLRIAGVTLRRFKPRKQTLHIK